MNADCELKVSDCDPLGRLVTFNFVSLRFFQICDFGLARGFQEGGSAETGQAGFMTECKLAPLVCRGMATHAIPAIVDVATRWYRAPEIMLSFANYVSLPTSRGEVNAHLEWDCLI